MPLKQMPEYCPMADREFKGPGWLSVQWAALATVTTLQQLRMAHQRLWWVGCQAWQRWHSSSRGWGAKRQAFPEPHQQRGRQVHPAVAKQCHLRQHCCSLQPAAAGSGAHSIGGGLFVWLGDNTVEYRSLYRAILFNWLEFGRFLSKT